MKRLTLISFLIALLSIVNCQLSVAQVGTWKSYLSYYQPQQIVKAGSNIIFVRASNGLYNYNLNDHSITTYDKINTLSDTYISHIAWNQQVKRLIIVYQNSNIDLMDLNEDVTNISSFYSKSMTESKTVNNIYIHKQYAYLTTAFGIVKVNMERAEIAETYNLGHNISYVGISNETIYAQINDNNYTAVFSASLSNNLIDPNNWTVTTDYPTNIFDADTSDWDKYLPTVVTLNPGGPKYNYFGFMKYENGKLYTCEGGSSDTQNTPAVQIYNNDSWHIYQDNIPSITGYSYYNTYCIDYDPTDTAHVFVGARNGLYEFRNGKFINLYNSNNSPIEAYNGKSFNSQLITGVKFNTDGTLWFLNSQAPTQSLIELTKDGKFVSHSIPEIMKLNDNGYTNKSLGNLSDMRFDSNGYLWFVNNNWYIASLYRYDLKNNTVIGFNSFTNQDGKSIENVTAVSCTREDMNGDTWVGTNRGLFLLEKSQIEESSPVFTQVKVPRNDGTNYADYLMDGFNITCIAIDGGNRKWIGTYNTGLYLISADNMEQLQHFTSTNSKLLSDNILSLAINNDNGEVFIGTDQGLCSYISDATTAAIDMTEDNVYAYPNPVQPGYDGQITIVGLSFDADVKILSVSGKLINQGRSSGGTYTWNGCDLNGKRVASGIYMVATATSDGNKGVVCKIAVIR